MTTLLQLYQDVREDKFTKEQTEKYYDQLCFLDADMRIELAELEKEEAVYYLKNKIPETTDKKLEYEWKNLEQGKRMIMLKAYLKANSRILGALKTRIYAKLN